MGIELVDDVMVSLSIALRWACQWHYGDLVDGVMDGKKSLSIVLNRPVSCGILCRACL